MSRLQYPSFGDRLAASISTGAVPVFRRRRQWTLTAEGLEFVGEPREWEKVILNDDSLGVNDPLWLLALIATSIDVTDKGMDTVLGERRRRYRQLPASRLLD